MDQEFKLYVTLCDEIDLFLQTTRNTSGHLLEPTVREGSQNKVGKWKEKKRKNPKLNLTSNNGKLLPAQTPGVNLLIAKRNATNTYIWCLVNVLGSNLIPSNLELGELVTKVNSSQPREHVAEGLTQSSLATTAPVRYSSSVHVRFRASLTLLTRPDISWKITPPAGEWNPACTPPSLVCLRPQTESYFLRSFSTLKP